MQRCKSERQRDIFGSQVSAVGYQVRVRVRVLNLYLVLNSRTRNLTAETWDLRRNHARRQHTGLRFPFEWLNRFGWRVAASGDG